MRRGWIGLLLLAGTLAPQGAARAWHDVGHAAVAAVAWKDLDPGTRRRVTNSLKRHPDYKIVWKPLVAASGLEEGEFLFLKAALWPDAIKDNPSIPPERKHPSRFLNVAIWHYKDKVYIPAGQPERKLPETQENALTTLQRARDTLAPGSNANTVSKTIALCWLFHLVGDIHQPLHATALVTDDFPEGDRGGNSFLIQHPQRNLHGYWDGLFDLESRAAETEERVAGAAETLAAALVQEQKRAALSGIGDPFNFGGWLEESYQLAADNVYNFTNGQGKRVALTPGVAGNAGKTPQPLPDGYDANAQVIGRRRVALAGYRLADALRKFFPAL